MPIYAALFVIVDAREHRRCPAPTASSASSWSSRARSSSQHARPLQRHPGRRRGDRRHPRRASTCSTVVQKMFFGPLTQPEEQAPAGPQRARDSSRSRRSSLLIFVIGLFPNIFLVADARTRSQRVVRATSTARVEDEPGAASSTTGPIKLTPARPEAPRRAARAPTREPPRAGERGTEDGHADIAFALSPLLIVARRRAAAHARRGVLAPPRRRRRRTRRPRARHRDRSSRGAAFAGARLAVRRRAASTGVAALAPWLIIDRFTLFFDMRALPRRRARGAPRRRLPARAPARPRRVLPAAPLLDASAR